MPGAANFSLKTPDAFFSPELNPSPFHSLVSALFTWWTFTMTMTMTITMIHLVDIDARLSAAGCQTPLPLDGVSGLDHNLLRVPNVT